MPIDTNKYVDLRPDLHKPEDIVRNIQDMQDELLHEYEENVTDVFDCEHIAQEPFFPDNLTDNICEPKQQEEADSTIEELKQEDNITCVEDMVEEVKKYGEELSEEAQKLTDTTELIGYLDEWLKNLEPIFEYHKTKTSANKKLYNILNEKLAVGTISTLYTMGTIKVFAAMKSWSGLLGLSVGNLVRGNTLFNFKFKYQYLDKVREKIATLSESYDGLGLDEDFFTDSRELEYEKYDMNDANGYLYNHYYALMEHPIDNFFTPSERGLVKKKKDAYKMTPSENVKEYVQDEYISVDVYDEDGGTTTYYVGEDYQKYQDFYTKLFKQEFESRCEKKYKKIKKGVAYKTILALLKESALKEVSLISKSSQSYKDSLAFIERYKKVQTLVEKLKNIKTSILDSFTEEKVKKDLQNISCFESGDVEEAPEVDADFSYGLNDPTLPNITKMCYWVKFCECATKYNLVAPYPELLDTGTDTRSGMPYIINSFRYWAVGFICPSPAGLVKVPLPTIYAPLFCITTAMGTLVLFLTFNGVFPTLLLMYYAKDGSISFPVTAGCAGVSYGNDPFNWTNEDEVSLLSKIGLDKSFKVPLMTPDEMIEFAKTRADALYQVANDKLLGVYSSITDKLDEAQLDLYTKFRMMTIAKNGDFNIENELKKIQNIFNDALDYINIAEYGSDKIDDIRGFVSWLLQHLEVPVIVLPDNLFEIQSQNPLNTIIQLVQDLLKTKIGLQLKPYDLREVICMILRDMLYDKRVDKILKKLPAKMTFINNALAKVQNAATKVGELGDKAKEAVNNKLDSMEEEAEFSAFKGVLCELIDLAIENIDPNIFYSDEQYLQYLNIASSAFNAYKCRTDLSLTEASLTFLAVLGQVIKLAMMAMTIEDFLKLFGSINFQSLEAQGIELARELVLSLLMELVMQNVPSIPIVDPFEAGKIMKGDLASAYAKMAKIAILISQVDADAFKSLILEMIPKIVIDLNTYIELLKEPIMLAVEELLSQAEAPFLYALEIKELIRKSINDFFTETNEALQPIIKTFNVAIKIFNTLKKLKEKNINFNTMDMVLRTKECAKKLAESMKNLDWKNIVMKALGLDGIVMVDTTLAELAIAAMKVFGVTFNNFIVAAICSTTGDIGKDAIRVLHPVSYSDDLPPYERLNLKNPLFCLFLDSFCQESKKHCGYAACYLPIGS